MSEKEAAGYYIGVYEQWAKCRSLKLSLDASEIDPVLIDVIYHMDVTFKEEQKKKENRKNN